jgi:DegV family protein with EDD domain
VVKIITDSTSCIPKNIVKKYDIRIVSLKIQFGQETYDEITGISNRDFYRRLTVTKDFPTTSQPSSSEFKDAYQQLLRQDPKTKILALTVSSKLSGTYNSALTAAEQLPEANITVFDSLSAATGLGLMVITAAEMTGAGYGLPEIITCLEQIRRSISIVFVVDTLEYLKRGGRIGTAAAFLGTVLDTKPLLTLVDGQIQPLDRVRTKKKAIERLFIELDHKLSSPDQPVQAGVIHVAAESEMHRLVTMVKARFNVTRFFASEAGPVIGAHLGPGAIGVGICPEPPALPSKNVHFY